MDKVVLEEKSQKTRVLKGERKTAHGIPLFQDDEEVSRRFEWLKERARLIATPEVAQATVARRALMNSLKQAIEKLKAAREEIHKAYLNALKLSSAGDDIAEDFMTSMADLANYTIAEFYAIRPFRRIQTSDSEIHYFPREFNINELSVNIKDFEKIKAKKNMKKEADKPLFLMRED